jgi:hypothetical protein
MKKPLFTRGFFFALIHRLILLGIFYKLTYIQYDVRKNTMA